MNQEKAPCRLCTARAEAIKNGTWDVSFRWCPHCGAEWMHLVARDGDLFKVHTLGGHS